MTIRFDGRVASSPARAMAWTRACAGAGEPRRESRSQRFRRGARRHRRIAHAGRERGRGDPQSRRVAMADGAASCSPRRRRACRQFRPGNYGAAKSGMIGLMNVLAEEGARTTSASTRSHDGGDADDGRTAAAAGAGADEAGSDHPACFICSARTRRPVPSWGAGAGSFAVIKIMETEGINLPPSDWTPEAVSAPLSRSATCRMAAGDAFGFHDLDHRERTRPGAHDGTVGASSLSR